MYKFLFYVFDILILTGREFNTFTGRINITNEKVIIIIIGVSSCLIPFLMTLKFWFIPDMSEKEKLIFMLLFQSSYFHR